MTSAAPHSVRESARPRSGAALYVHIPFCESKCSYCDFYSVPHDGSGRAKYVEAIRIEIDRRKPAAFRPATIFVGGGTPTSLDDRDFRRTLEIVAQAAGVDPGACDDPLEWTVECNPGSLTPTKAAAMRSAGVTRVSIGVQSFDDRILRSVGRVHDGATARDAVRIARDAGIPQVSIDLLFAIPGQGLATFERDLDQAVLLGTDHVSAYALLYEEGTALERMREAGRVEREDEDIELLMLRRARERLGDAGFRRYEISNFARPGCECRHNLNYWRNGEYLGVGASAASYLGGERRTNAASWRAWEDSVHAGRDPVAFSERLPAERAMGEEVMLRLRTEEGFATPDLAARWNLDAAQIYAPLLGRFSRAGLLAERDGRWVLTDSGFEVADAVMAEFVVSGS